jgi:hypothetical protein
MGLASHGRPTIDFSWLLRDSDEDAGFELDDRFINESALQKYPAMHGLQQPCFSEGARQAARPGPPAWHRHHRPPQGHRRECQHRLEGVALRLVQRLHRENRLPQALHRWRRRPPTAR